MLDEYRNKRDFAVTAEPPPTPGATTAAPMFVVQKHAARRAGLHYDFRLEHAGVLWSWAVPRGPSLDPADRRMAIHVEDHPIAYADFQGTIPDGQYGAGAVETWDRGTWEPIDDPEYGMAKGHLHFRLHGDRLTGRWSLIRAPNRDPRKPEAWFLVRHAEDPAHVAAPPGAVPGPLPETQAPQLCGLNVAPPPGDEWLTEIKLDGYRILARLDHGAVRLLTRNGLDWADRLPTLARAIAALPLTAALFDGELVSSPPTASRASPPSRPPSRPGARASLPSSPSTSCT